MEPSPSTLADFSLEFQFDPRTDLSSSANALSFTSGILPAVDYRADAEIADQIATFAFNHVSSRGWCYGLSMSVTMETIQVFDERRDDDLLDSSDDLSDDYEEVDEDEMMIEEEEEEEGFEEVNGKYYGDTALGVLRSEEVSGDEEEGECCCICLEEVIRGRGVVMASLSPCSHRFHHTCIAQWLDNKPTCPICRRRCTGVRIS
ncbi:PREDICTED: E3 ubiquitin ligase BIG BROTHER-related-like [Ipomoea nil]|uniref:E3 ubiquitin ligase BIG BROTHER-related-like n=1 Tax=Ipomoea nil TaxID=35883 RepID=UPI000900C9D9|nr:PREDICTED: E3 ubiquitin ligase BIG BROTHER-related-like [Ipomoea nil]